jgi:O-Antigen ligase
VVLIGVVHTRSRSAGLAALMGLWLLGPLIRRLIDLAETTSGPDLLALAPFAATGVVAIVDYTRYPLSARAWLFPGAALAGLLIGVPAGFTDPDPLAFGFVAYVAGISGFFIGYAEPVESGRAPQLERVLFLLVPPVALYGLYQALFPLPVWDAEWLDAANNPTFGTKEAGNFRVFATLNAPFTLGAVLTVFSALALVSRRQTAYVTIVGALGLACMGVTYVRSAWVGLAFAMVLALILGRGRYLTRVLVLAAAVLALIMFTGPIGAQVVERAQTLGSLGRDVSAQERLRTTSSVLPEALRAPIGAGIGAVGQARVISDVPERRNFPDNGYLALLWQLGPVGFLLIVGSIFGAAIWSARGPVGREWQALRVSAGVALGTLLFLQIGADVLYGVTAPMAWYFAGLLVRIRETATAGFQRPSTR